MSKLLSHSEHPRDIVLCVRLHNFIEYAMGNMVKALFGLRDGYPPASAPHAPG